MRSSRETAIGTPLLILGLMIYALVATRSSDDELVAGVGGFAARRALGFSPRLHIPSSNVT